MIVQPDFLDHWKTNALAARIGKLEAITALISLWGHCHRRQTWIFPPNPAMLAGICRFLGASPILVEAFLELQLIDVTEYGEWEVHDWAETNAQLVHNWTVGKTGGRPKKKRAKTQGLTQGETQGLTLGEPEGKPIGLDKIREENTPVVPKGTEPEFPLDLPAEYRDSLTLWWHYKKERRESYKPTGWATLVNRERQFSAAQVHESVQRSMANNYSGLFTDKIDSPASPNGHFGPRKKEEGAGTLPDADLMGLPELADWRGIWPLQFDGPCPEFWSDLRRSTQLLLIDICEKNRRGLWDE